RPIKLPCAETLSPITAPIRKAEMHNERQVMGGQQITLKMEDIMKNAALITLLISGIAFSSLAQERGQRASRSAEEIAQMRTDRLTEQLALTEDQQQAVYALSLDN